MRYLLLIICLATSCKPAQKTATNNQDATPFLGTRWALRTLAGGDITGNISREEPYIIFGVSGNTLSGNGGCNQITASFTTEDERVIITNVAATKMACSGDGVISTENGLLKVLRYATWYEIQGKRLHLYKGEEKLAEFEATVNKK